MWWGTQRRSAGRRSTTSPGPKRPSAAISTARSSRGGKSWSRPWQFVTPKQIPGLHQHHYMGGSTCRTLECHYYLHETGCEVKTFDLSVHRETHCLKKTNCPLVIHVNTTQRQRKYFQSSPTFLGLSHYLALLAYSEKEGQDFCAMAKNVAFYSLYSFQFL